MNAAHNCSLDVHKPVLDIVIAVENNWVGQERYLFRLTETEWNNEEFAIFLKQDCTAILNSALEYGFKEIEYNSVSVNENFIEMHNRLCEIEIQGKKMAEMLTFEGISLLQFVPERCYTDPLRGIILLIEYVSELVDRYTPGRLRVIGCLNESYLSVLSLISRKYQVPVEYYKLNGNDSKASRRRDVDSLRPWSFALRMMKNRFKNGAYARSLRNESIEPDNVLLISYPRSLWSRTDGTFYDDMYNSFKGFCSVNRLRSIRVEVPYYYQAKGNIKDYIRLVKTGRPGGFDGAFLDEFLDESMLAQIEQLRNDQDAKFFEYTKQSEFLKNFLWKDVSFFEPLLTFWYDLFVNHLFCGCALSLLAARKMMQALKPSAVFACYEVGSHARAVIIEAHRAGIPSFGLQHAMINERVSYYRMRKQNHRPDLSRPCYDMIIPFKTLVFGAEYKDFLIHVGHYPADAVEVTGIDWRLLNIQEKYSNVHALAKLRTEWFGNKKLAVVLSGLSTIDALNHLVSKLSSDQWAVLVKMHPFDANGDLYEKALQKKGFRFLLTKDYLYESLGMADIVFAPASSTVILDALYYGRPTLYYENIPRPYSERWKKMAANMYSVAQYETYSVAPEKKKQIQDCLKKIGYCAGIDTAAFTNILNDTIGKYIKTRPSCNIGADNTISDTGLPNRANKPIINRCFYQAQISTCEEGVLLARQLKCSGERLRALDVLDLLLSRYPDHAIKTLAEVYEISGEMPEVTRYYQIIEKHKDEIVRHVGMKLLLEHYAELLRRFKDLNDYIKFQEIKTKIEFCLVQLKQDLMPNMAESGNSESACKSAVSEKERNIGGGVRREGLEVIHKNPGRFLIMRDYAPSGLKDKIFEVEKL